MELFSAPVQMIATNLMFVPHLHTKRQVEMGEIQEPVFSLKPSGQHQKDWMSIYFARK